MAQTTGQHDDHEFEAFWNDQGDTLFWGAVVTKDGRVVGRPQGKLMKSAIGSDDEAAVIQVVKDAIDEGLDVSE